MSSHIVAWVVSQNIRAIPSWPNLFQVAIVIRMPIARSAIRNFFTPSDSTAPPFLLHGFDETLTVDDPVRSGGQPHVAVDEPLVDELGELPAKDEEEYESDDCQVLALLFLLFLLAEFLSAISNESIHPVERRFSCSRGLQI